MSGPEGLRPYSESAREPSRSDRAWHEEEEHTATAARRVEQPTRPEPPYTGRTNPPPAPAPDPVVAVPPPEPPATAARPGEDGGNGEDVEDVGHNSTGEPPDGTGIANPPTPRASPGEHLASSTGSPRWYADLLARLTPLDREVVWWWLLTRLAVLIVALSAPTLFSVDGKVPGPLQRWEQWDFEHFDRIATHGYFQSLGDPEEAFFPGLPMLLRFGTWFGIPTIATGLVVSFVAGGIAAVALARLAEREFGPGVGQLAAVAWMVSPLGVFLVAPYTEALFLAFAITAWLAARRGRWAVTGVLAAGACSVRVSGIFLVVALGVEFVTSHHRRWRQLPWLAVPAAPVLGYMTYLWAKSGDWLAWYHAQEEGWSRGFTWPWESLANTWDVAIGQTKFDGADAAMQLNFEWMYRAELVAMGIGVALTVLLLLYRRWGEASWVGIQIAAFATSYWFFSVPRSSLLWFPLWMALGALAVRRPWVWRCYLALAVPLFVLWTVAYLRGNWAG